MTKISVVINTLNEEKNLPRAIKSVKDFASEIVVCDMFSEDNTREIAEKLGAKVFTHKKTNYVEPARNYALRQAQGDWILVLDADEEISESLAKELQGIAKEDLADYVCIPRKNIIFEKWISHSRWWPDYLIRFFKKGKVVWKDEIHSEPQGEGRKLLLAPEEDKTIIHYNYSSLDQYLERMFRYSKVQSEELVKSGYLFSYKDLIRKPTGEFLGRYFAGEGFKDGVHGLVLALLQSFSELVVYLRTWEKQGYKEEETKEVFKEMSDSTHEINWWVNIELKDLVRKILLKAKII